MKWIGVLHTSSISSTTARIYHFLRISTEPSRKHIRNRVAELEEELPSETERWIVSLLDTLPERDDSSRVFVVEDTRDGQPVFENPERVVRRASGVVETADGSNLPKPPEEFTHVASGPKGVTSPVVHQWKLYADLEIHTPPESVSVELLPVKY